jgi:hypothetical protein
MVFCVTISVGIKYGFAGRLGFGGIGGYGEGNGKGIESEIHTFTFRGFRCNTSHYPDATTVLMIS